DLVQGDGIDRGFFETRIVVNCARVRVFIAPRSQDLRHRKTTLSNPKPWRFLHCGKVILHLRLGDPPDIVVRYECASCQRPKKGGSRAELESAICILTASPHANARIYSRSNFNRDGGGHDSPRYARRLSRSRAV